MSAFWQFLHEALVANLDQPYPDKDPDHLTDARIETGENTDRGRADAQNLDDNGQTAFTGSQLHGKEKQQVAQQGRESQNEHGITETYRHGEGTKDEEVFQGIDHTCQIFQQQRRIEGPRLLMQIGDVTVYLDHVLLVAFIEPPGIFPGERYMQQYAVELDYHASLVTYVKEIKHNEKYHRKIPKSVQRNELTFSKYSTMKSTTELAQRQICERICIIEYNTTDDMARVVPMYELSSITR